MAQVRRLFAPGFLIAALALVDHAAAQYYTISTIAGNGRLSFAGAGGSAASVNLIEPQYVAVDSSGNIYFTDAYYNQAFRVSPSGTITVYAGTGIAGYSGDNGPAASAELSNPTNVTVDASGNLYINDNGNGVIRKVAVSGTITTVATVSASGFTLDSQGNMYVSRGNTIGRINADGSITTLAGTGQAGYSGDGGQATAAMLNSPSGLRLDSSGNIYFADRLNERIRRITAQGIISTIAGNGQIGAAGNGVLATSASFTLPRDVALDAAGDVFIAGASDGLVREVDTTGKITVVAGGGNSLLDGPATSAALGLPSGITLDNSGNLVVAVYYGRQIRRISQGAISTVAGALPSTLQNNNAVATTVPLLDPWGVVTDSAGNVYVTDNLDARIREISPSGIITTFAGTGVAGDSGNGGAATIAEVGLPRGASFDSSGNFYFASGTGSRVRRISPNGIINDVAGSSNGFSGDGGSALVAQLFDPLDVAPDGAGGYYIADSDNNRIRYVSAAGVIETIAGTGVAGYTGDGGPAQLATLNAPRQMALDGSGNLYIADTGNSVIRKISRQGIITTAAGNGTAGGAGDGGLATAAELSTPPALTLDAQGNLYIGSSARIRKVTASTGIISTVAGTGFTGFGGDGGIATAAQMNGVQALAFDNAGNLYFTDEGNLRVRKLSLTPVSSVANAATFVSGPVAPGEIVAVFGTGLGPSTPVGLQLNSSGAVATELAGTQVTFDDIPAPLLYVSSSQINLVVPYEIAGEASTVMQVTAPNAPPNSLTIAVTAASPGVFAIANLNGTVNSAANPMPIGSALVIYATGQGQTNPPGVDGSVATSVFPAPVLPVTVKIGGQTVNPLYAGAAPDFVAGVLQLNVQPPAGLHGAQSIQIQVATATTPTGLQVFLQ